jgi:hypothetical protein
MNRRESHIIRIDQLPSISISQFVEKGIIPAEPGYKKTSISLRNNHASYQFQIIVVTDSGYPHLEIWNVENPDLVQHISLTRMKSNLPCNPGYHYFFVCPETGRKCKRLHLHDDRFIHRLGIAGGTYTYLGLSLVSKIRYTQIRNQKKSRVLLLERSKPFFKSYYNGLPTKRELKVRDAVVAVKRLQRIYSKESHLN